MPRRLSDRGALDAIAVRLARKKKGATRSVESRDQSASVSTRPATHRRALGYRRRYWTAAEDRRMRREYPHLSTKVIAALLQRTVTSVYARATLLGLVKSPAYCASVDAFRFRRGQGGGEAFRYPKGHVPANKGLRRPGWGPGRMKATQFKKGVPTPRTMPIGSTRLVDGYVYRKVSDVQFVPYTVNWKPEHHLIWTRRHGPIPAGHALRFTNGNRLDVRLGNLELVHRRELMARNTVHNLPKPLAQAVQLLGALTRQIRKRSPAGEKQDRRPA